MTFPFPQAPAHANVPNIYEAVGRFLLKYAVPAVPQENIYKGFKNRVALPKGTNEYIIMTLLNQVRHGTNVDTYSATGLPVTADGINTTKQLVELAVQIDCYSDSHDGRQRATAIEMMARSPHGVQFFNQFGMSCLYADDVRDLTGVTDADQFVYRYMTTLHLTYWAQIDQTLPWFDAVDVDLKNVDVTFPPTEQKE